MAKRRWPEVTLNDLVPAERKRNMAVIQDFLGTLERALVKSPGSLSATTKLSDIAELDSVGRLSVMVMADSEYAFLLEAEALERCKTVEELFLLITGGRQ
mgnify:CR=1 FL=1